MACCSLWRHCFTRIPVYRGNYLVKTDSSAPEEINFSRGRTPPRKVQTPSCKIREGGFLGDIGSLPIRAHFPGCEKRVSVGGGGIVGCWSTKIPAKRMTPCIIKVLIVPTKSMSLPRVVLASIPRDNVCLVVQRADKALSRRAVLRWGAGTPVSSEMCTPIQWQFRGKKWKE